MATEAAFLRAILDAPDDDTPRLVYADWLDEHGDAARAEFIRAQCEAERLPEGEPRQVALTVRAGELLAAHGARWRQEIPAWARRGSEFRRGFVAEVRCSAGQFLRSGGGLFRKAPVQFLRLGAVGDRGAALAASPHLARLRGLDLPEGRPEQLIPLLASPHLTGLRSLGFYPVAPHPLGGFLRSLVAAPALAGLTDLLLGAGALAPGEVALLTASPLLGNLRSLRLRYNYFRPPDLDALLCSAGLGHLDTLELWGYVPYYQNLGLLQSHLRLPTLQQLTALDLTHNHLCGPRIRCLAEAPLLGNLRRLILQKNNLRADDVATLAHSPYLAGGRLRVLDLSVNDPRTEGIEALLSGPPLPLTVLRLSHQAIGDDGARLLASTDRLPSLVVVDVSFTAVGPAGRQALRDRFGAGAVF
jgi:uncharacterized protein (TIGR02996 family)